MTRWLSRRSWFNWTRTRSPRHDALVETWDALGIPYGSAGRPAVAKSDRIVPLLVPKSGG
ncbi:MAG: hypothetical protein ABIQ51_22670 [Mesorhizobium sp.]